MTKATGILDMTTMTSLASQLGNILDDISQNNKGEYDKTEGGYINDRVFGKFQVHGDFARLVHFVGIDCHSPGGNEEKGKT